MRKAEKEVGGIPPANSVSLPFPTPRKCHGGENQGQAAAPPARPEKGARAKGAGKQGHSPLLIFMSQEKILHLLPPEVQLVVIVAFDCLGLIHRVIQRQEEFLEGLHYRWRHTQVNLSNAAQPGLDRQDMVLHDVDVWVAPGLRGAVSWSPTPPSIRHVIATVVWVRAVLIPVSPHALLWGTKFVSRGREALPSVPIIVSIFTPTAALTTTVPLSVIPIVPSPSFISFPGTVIVTALPSKFVPASSIVFIITVTHGAVRGGLAAVGAVGSARRRACFPGGPERATMDRKEGLKETQGFLAQRRMER